MLCCNVRGRVRKGSRSGASLDQGGKSPSVRRVSLVGNLVFIEAGGLNLPAYPSACETERVHRHKVMSVSHTVSCPEDAGRYALRLNFFQDGASRGVLLNGLNKCFIDFGKDATSPY